MAEASFVITGPLSHVSASLSYILINEKGMMHESAMDFFPEPGIMVFVLNSSIRTLPEMRTFAPVTVSRCTKFIRSNLNVPREVGPAIYPFREAGDAFAVTDIVNV
jgi:hypothetical protein